ncbi:MAG TPA: flagellar basal-body rod protein FlgF [Deltaproteobacteria bacterium]|jgi:flagellar basal-body rod protein FlgF|nr:flagellar basal-body rod protein FlgF [Deltaproteobacteria bacterium]HQO79581.1 flagellar basal-body rod protein FlgF [Deltaproteobacteria bacterium]HRR67835.1 flagellar basal-body rod protein FlgF [Desulfomonilia bacterium]HRT43890.1 flagellar basal-body rod protein FlgF [Desulfomonilia bacterium]
MDQGIYTAAAGAIAMEERLAIISNNLANINTAGFKKNAVSFEEFQRVLDASLLSPGQYRSIPVDVILGGQYIDTAQGSFRDTGNPLDAAIVGEGFFVVNTENGPRYTRAGAFQISPEGLLVTPQGYPVQGQGGDITVGSGIVTIDSQGRIMVDGNIADVLQIVAVEDYALMREGNSLFAVREGYFPEIIDVPDIRQGCIESANVDPIGEMIGLITTQRAYESFQRVIKSVDDAYAQSIRNVGTTA